MARKTIEVGKVLRMANTFLAAKNTKADEREGVCSLLEAILFETGNYEGFRYLEGSDYPEEFDGLGSRRFYFASKTVLADEAQALRNVNRIRV
jgi:hypothetical protein